MTKPTTATRPSAPRATRNKQQIVALVEPSTGRAKAFHVKRATTEKLRNILFTTVDRKSTLVSDESRLYTYTGKAFGKHQKIHHASVKYVNKDGFTTNNAENFFGVFKRSIKANIVVSEQHLNRYVAESVFRYTNRKMNDFERALQALKGIEGKRLTYRPIG